MKAIIKRMFRAAEPTPAREAAHSAMSSELGTSDIESYYLSLIRDCLGRMLVSPDTIRVDVWRSGANARGQPMFAGYVRILKWDPVLTPVLLQNIPVIDGRVRRVAQASVLLEGTAFAGLWFQATSATENAPTTLLGVPAEIVHQPTAAP